jgi:hypothetical protein
MIENLKSKIKNLKSLGDPAQRAGAGGSGDQITEVRSRRSTVGIFQPAEGKEVMTYDLPQIAVISYQFCHAERGDVLHMCPSPHRRDNNQRSAVS